MIITRDEFIERFMLDDVDCTHQPELLALIYDYHKKYKDHFDLWFYIGDKALGAIVNNLLEIDNFVSRQKIVYQWLGLDTWHLALGARWYNIDEDNLQGRSDIKVSGSNLMRWIEKGASLTLAVLKLESGRAFIYTHSN